jgi:hypothetical protein
MNLFKKLWNFVSNYHIPKDVNNLKRIQLQILNQYAFLISIFFFIDSVRDLLFGFWINFYVLFALGVIFLLLFLFTKIRFNSFILLGCCLLLLLLIFYFSSIGGFNNGIALYYFAVLSAVLFIFNGKNEFFFRIIIYVMITILFSISHFYDFNIFRLKDHEDELLTKNQRIITFFQVFMITILNGYFIARKNYVTAKLYHKTIRSENMIQDLKRKLNTDTTNNNIEDLVKLAINNDISFMAAFRNFFPNFYNNLIVINPDMTFDELKFCALLKLGFTTKDIAEYAHLTFRTVQTKKNRLRKSFNIPSEIDLYKWVDEI